MLSRRPAGQPRPHGPDADGGKDDVELGGSSIVVPSSAITNGRVGGAPQSLCGRAAACCVSKAILRLPEVCIRRPADRLGECSRGGLALERAELAPEWA